MHGFSPLLVGLLAAAARPSTASFADPELQYRPKFRYWLPDASIPPATLTTDIHAIAAANAGGIELLPYYQYGLPESETRNEPPPTDWTRYGFGTPAYVEVFKAALQASKDAGTLIDFALGANQGQGVPADPGSGGLAVELAYANVTVAPGETFSAALPLSTQPPNLFSSFMHSTEEFGAQTLQRVVAVEVLESDVTDLSAATGVALNLATTTLGEVVDVTGDVNEERELTWTAPEGNSTWRLIAWYERYTNQRSCAGGLNATDFLGNGSWTVDHFSANGSTKLTDFFDEHVVPDEETKALLAEVGKYAWEDSMEMVSTLWWTPGFFEKFEEARGYDMTLCLPYLMTNENFWNGALTPYAETFLSQNTTLAEKCNEDYRTTLNEGYQEYLGAFETWAHGLGIEYSAQPAYNLPLNMLDDIAILDAPEGESLGFSNIIDTYRQFSGPAHLAGISVISSECGALSGAPYQQTLQDLLWSVRRGLATGVSMHVLHGFAYSGDYTNTTWPSYTTFTYRFSEMWNQNQPSWRHMNDTLAYIARNQYVSQSGPPSVDLAFYHYSAPWLVERQYSDTNLETLGYTYEYLSAGNVLTEEAVVEDGILAPNGPSYKALIFSNQTAISAAAAAKVQDFATAGLPVFFVGATNFTSIGQASGEADNVTSTINAILNSGLANVHTVSTSTDLPDALSNAGILPKVSFPSGAPSWYPFWRRADGIDYAFIYNDGPSSQTLDVTFATTLPPYHFNAWTGAITPILHYTSTSTTTTIPLTLAANQTTILGFPHSNSSTLPAAPPIHITSAPPSLLALTSNSTHLSAHLTAPATLTLSTGRELNLSASPPPATNLTTWHLAIEDWHRTATPLSVATEKTLHSFTNTTLRPWSALGLPSVSGVGRYTASFTRPSSSSPLAASLHLGPLTDSVRVWVNGAMMPAVDLADAVVDVGEWVREGANEVVVEVGTTLFNRVKAEANQTWAVGVLADAENEGWYGSHAVKAYGLVGPVWVEWMEVVEVVG